MSIPWSMKSKNNNSPIINYKGTCPNCGQTHLEYIQDTRVNCCLETIKCSYAIDTNEGKVDFSYGATPDNCNNGKTAYYINLGYSDTHAKLLYLNSSKHTPELSLEDLLVFGKHKGDLVKDVPIPYIVWAIENVSVFKLDTVAINTYLT